MSINTAAGAADINVFMQSFITGHSPGGVGEWYRMIYHFAENTNGFLEEYFQRNQSESGIAEDKKRTC